MPQMVITPDGWTVLRQNVGYLRFATGHQPPRTGALLFQLKLDAKSRGPWIFWAGGAFEIARAAAYGGWSHLAFGVGLLAAYVLMFIPAARNLRNYPAAVGVIDALRPHRVIKQISTAAVVTADGREVQLIVPTALIAGMVGGGRQAEVVFLHAAAVESCLVIAARALPDVPPNPPPSGSE